MADKISLSGLEEDGLSDIIVKGVVGVGVFLGKTAYEALIAHHGEVGSHITDLYRRSSRDRSSVDTSTVQTEYHVDEVFVVLARLGERLLALDLLDIDILNSARNQLAIELGTCKNTDIQAEFEKLQASLQYLITGALYFCAACHPNVIYRGFGAGVWDTWSWGCPDPERLPKAKRKHIFGKLEPAPQITTLPDFDEVIALIKSHPIRDSVLKEYPRGISRDPPRFSRVDEKDKDYRANLKMLRDFSEELDKRGHPIPKDGSVSHVARWQVPYSTWHSQFSSQDQKNHSWEEVIAYQMDAGKILYAFTVDRRLDLPDDEALVLPPASAAEQLCDWLQNKPGTSHRVLRWEELETENIEKHVGRTTKKYLGRDPLPNRFAFRHPNPVVPKNALYRYQSGSMSSPQGGAAIPADYFASGMASPGSVQSGNSQAQAIYEASYASPLHSPRAASGAMSPVSVSASANQTVRQDSTTGEGSATASTDDMSRLTIRSDA